MHKYICTYTLYTYIDTIGTHTIQYIYTYIYSIHAYIEYIQYMYNTTLVYILTTSCWSQIANVYSGVMSATL